MQKVTLQAKLQHTGSCSTKVECNDSATSDSAHRQRMLDNSRECDNSHRSALWTSGTFSNDLALGKGVAVWNAVVN